MFPYNENKTCNFSPYKKGDVGGGGDGMGISQFWKSYVDASIFFQLSDLGEGGGGIHLYWKKNLFEKKIYKVPEYDVICWRICYILIG